MEAIQRNLVATMMEIVIPSTEILSTTAEHIRDHCPFHIPIVENGPTIDTIMIHMPNTDTRI